MKNKHYFRLWIEGQMAQGKGHHLFRNCAEDQQLSQNLPELVECIEVDGGPYHCESIFEHSVSTLEAANDYEILLQWAALLHDIGKPDCAAPGPTGVSFHRHEVFSTEKAYNICKRLGFSKREIKYITTLIRWHMFYFPKETTDKAIKKWLFRVGKERWPDLFKLRVADRLGNKANKYKPAITKEMKQLEIRINKIISESEAIFREDLAIKLPDIKKIADLNKYSIEEIYAMLIGLVNISPNKNYHEILTRHIKKVCK